MAIFCISTYIQKDRNASATAHALAQKYPALLSFLRVRINSLVANTLKHYKCLSRENDMCAFTKICCEEFVLPAAEETSGVKKTQERTKPVPSTSRTSFKCWRCRGAVPSTSRTTFKCRRCRGAGALIL